MFGTPVEPTLPLEDGLRSYDRTNKCLEVWFVALLLLKGHTRPVGRAAELARLASTDSTDHSLKFRAIFVCCEIQTGPAPRGPSSRAWGRQCVKEHGATRSTR